MGERVRVRGHLLISDELYMLYNNSELYTLTLALSLEGEGTGELTLTVF